MDNEEIKTAVEGLTEAVRRIAYGSPSGPTGLEMVAIAVAGDGLRASAGESIAQGFSEVATAVREGLGEIADALRDKGPRDC